MPTTRTLRKCLPTAVAGAVVALLAAGCFGGGGTKAGGAFARHTTVLTLASAIRGGQTEQLSAFAHEVEALSDGTLRIRFAGNWRAGDVKQERKTIADVRAGKVDLAWVGARAWDWEGVTSFDALLAPFLIDSHALEQRVFGSGMPQRMLPSVRKAGVVPIGVLPGPLRTVLGVGHPLVAPADFRARTIGVQGIVAAETLRALGAKPRQYFAQPRLTGLDGMEEQLGAILGNRHTAPTNYLSANLNLWPRPLVIFAAPRLFRSLTPRQQSTLRRAAAAAVDPAMAVSRNEDSQAAAVICRTSMRIVEAKPAELLALRRAVAPVYRQLSRDAATRRLVAQIETMKRKMTPDVPPPCRSGERQQLQAVTPLDGVWEMSVARGDLLRNPAYKVRPAATVPTEEDLRLDVGDYRLVLHRGRAWSGHRSAAENVHETRDFTVHGGIVQFRWKNGNDVGEIHTYRWSIYRGMLTLRRAPPGYPSTPPNPMFAPWHHARGTLASSRRPRTSVDGVYEVTTSAADLTAVGSPDVVPENYGKWVLVFDGGRFAFTQEDKEACTWGYGTLTVKGRELAWSFVDGGGIAPNGAFNRPGEFLRYGWSRYRNTFTLTPVKGAVSPGNFRAKPWHLVSSAPSRHSFSKRCPPPREALR